VIYTHSCPKCGAEFTKKEAFFDRLVKRCPACQSGIVQRIVRDPVIVFKDVAWYAAEGATGVGGLDRVRRFAQPRNKS
jgi:putative FmdB family regulatory protein